MKFVDELDVYGDLNLKKGEVDSTDGTLTESGVKFYYDKNNQVLRIRFIPEQEITVSSAQVTTTTPSTEE